MTERSYSTVDFVTPAVSCARAKELPPGSTAPMT